MSEQFHPIFVIEGPDGTGKSTLAKALCEKLDAKYRHLTYRWPKSMDLYHWAGFEHCLADSVKRPVVLDRWWPSEVVYAAAFRGGTSWPQFHRMLDRVALKHRVFYVLALPKDRDAYIKHYEILKGKRVEMYDSMHRVYDLFVDWETTMNGRPDFVTYDFMTEGSEFFDEYVDQLICEAFDWFVGNPVFGSLINDRRTAGQLVCPEVLFVGDKSSPKGRRSNHWPFFDRGNHCSTWLAAELQRAGIPEHKLAWANAHDSVGNTQINEDLVRTISARHVISLGAQASSALRKLGVTHKMLYHPQFYKRFEPDMGAGDFANLARNLNLKPENWNERAFSNLGLA